MRHKSLILVLCRLALSKHPRYTTKLSSYRTDKAEKSQKKIVFAPDCPAKFKEQKFKYSEDFKFVFQRELPIINNYTSEDDFFIEDFNEQMYWFADEDDYYDQFIHGPRFNLEVKRSQLSDLIPHEMFGLFAREKIPKGSLLGIYNGLTTFGAEADWDNYQLTELAWEYVYMGERDYVDSAFYGNFMRFANHQDQASIDYSNHFIPKTFYFDRGLITVEEFDILPDYIEIIAMYALEDIEAGEEIFLNYGDYYWKDLDVKPVRANNIKQLNKVIVGLETEVQRLERENKQLQYKLSASKKQVQAYKKHFQQVQKSKP